NLHLRRRAGRNANPDAPPRPPPAPRRPGLSPTPRGTPRPPRERHAPPHPSPHGRGAAGPQRRHRDHPPPPPPPPAESPPPPRQPQEEGAPSRSDPDPEAAAQLTARPLAGALVEAVRKVLPQLKGTYGLAVVSPGSPDVLVGARLGSPLVVGIGEDEHFLASD